MRPHENLIHQQSQATSTARLCRTVHIAVTSTRRGWFIGPRAVLDKTPTDGPARVEGFKSPSQSVPRECKARTILALMSKCYGPYRSSRPPTATCNKSD